MKYNGEFKQIDTEEKAYMLGQLFGDGCNQYINDYKIDLASTIEDKEFYKRLHTIFPFFNYHDKWGNKAVVHLQCGYKELCLDLKNLGLTQNKCKQDELGNFNLPKLEEPFMQHFIRGFFDADGSVWHPERYRSRNNTRVEIGLGAKNFCKQLHDYLVSKGINMKYRERLKTSGAIDNDKIFMSYSTQATSRKESQKFANYIYKDATIYLERKKKLFNIYKRSALQLRRETLPNCPKCGKKFTVMGKRNGKLRIRCKNCHISKTIPMPPTYENE